MNPYQPRLRSVLSIAFAAFALASSARAHHGQDFILLEDWHLPAPGSGNVMTNFEWEHSSDGNEYGLGPSLMIGVLPRVALSVDVDFRNEDSDWQYNSVMPTAHFQITGPKSDLPFRVGLSVGYQFVDGSFSDVGHEHASSSEHEHEHADEHAHEHADEHSHEHADEHAASEESSGHSHGESIHNHDSDALTSRLIIEGDFGATKAIFNLISVARSSGGASWGYAAGVRHKVIEQLAFGVEAIGDFDSHGWHELVGGVYYEPVHNVTLKVGAGFGLTEETPDFTLRTGFVWRF